MSHAIGDGQALDLGGFRGIRHARGSELLLEPLTTAVTPHVVLPPGAGARLRSAFGLKSDRRLRISYLPGPGDVYGTYRHWRAGAVDPRVPTVAYSSMFYEFCAQIDALGQVMTRQPAPDRRREGRFRFDQVGVEVRGYPGAPRRLRAVWRSVVRARAFRPDAVIVGSDIDPVAIPALKAIGARVILSVHNTYRSAADVLATRTLKERLVAAVRHAGLRTIDAAICTSEECRRQLLHIVPGASAFVHAPQPVARARAVKRTPARRLLFLGRVEGDKGIFDLLEAFRRLALDSPSIDLVYAGAGGAEEALRRAVDESGLSKRVQCSGQLDAAGVAKALIEADILVCPTRSSFREGLAMVCIEAAALGVPSVVSSAVPAAEALPQSATVFAADDPDALHAALQRLISSQLLLQKKRLAAIEEVERLTDPAGSWGSLLYPALVAAAA